jgi:hypothetical protein
VGEFLGKKSGLSWAWFLGEIYHLVEAGGIHSDLGADFVGQVANLTVTGAI